MGTKVARALAFSSIVRKEAAVKISCLEGLEKAENRSLNGVAITAIDPVS